MMKDNPSIHILIAGETAEGNERDNLHLSQRRADYVRNYFQQKGVGKNRMKATGLGSLRDPYQNESQVTREHKRRADIIITDY
jgi:outer membrane protein OmpA-like peptidoglycan-associated protein